MGSLLKYKKAYMIGIQNTMEYRENYLVNLISVFFPIIIQFFVWKAVYSGKSADTKFFDYTYAQMLTYSLTAGFIAKIISSRFHYEVSGDIKNGSLSRFLVQPIKYFYFRAVYYIGEKTSESVIIFAIMLIVMVVLGPIFGLNIRMANVCLLIFDLLPSLALTFLMFFMVSLLAFWIIEVGHLFGIIDILIAIASGAILPLNIFGDQVLNFIELLPFPYTTYFLTNILSGKINTYAFLNGLSMQFIWIFILAVLCFLFWKQGLKKYTAVGG